MTYKSVQISEEAHAKIAEHATKYGMSYRDTATRMIEAYKPTIHTTWFADSVSMTGGQNTIQAYLEGWDVNDYTMKVNDLLMTNSGVIHQYLQQEVKHITSPLSEGERSFIFVAYDLNGKELARRTVRGSVLDI